MSEQPAERCPECGRALRMGVRVMDLSVVRVLVCLDARTGDGCGHETPPLYKRKRWQRDWNYAYLPLRVGGDTEQETVSNGR